MISEPADFNLRFPSGLAGGDSQLTATETGCVLFPLGPIADESLAGFILRTASWNHLDSATLLRPAGIEAKASFSAGVAPKIPEVARRLGVPIAELTHRTYTGCPGAAQMVTYFGTAIERFRLNLNTRRLSPASLRVSPHHRALWEIGAINFCPDSWEFLIDQCPRCHGKLSWRRAPALDLCGACGTDLKQVGVTKVEPAHREMLALAADLVHPIESRRRAARSALPEAFHTFSETAIFELALIFSRALRRHASDPWLRSDLRPAVRLAKAMELIHGFPRGMEDVVRVSQQDNARESEFLLQWADDLGASRYPELRSFARHVAILRGTRRLKAMREAKGNLTLREVASRLQIQRSDVSKLVRLGVFGPAIERGDVRVLRWFHPEAVEIVNSRLKDRVSAREFERSFGLPRAATEQFLSLGMLHVSADPAVCELYRGLQLTRASVVGLTASIEEALWQPRPGVPTITLDDLFQGVGGMEKPWGAIITAFLADRLPGGLSLGPGTRVRFGDLIVQREFAEAFHAGRHRELMAIPPPTTGLAARDHVSRTETERYLNCFPRDIAWLIENGHLAVAAGAPLRIVREDVLRLGALVISSREILRRWRVSPTFRDGLTTRYGIERGLGPFWPRAAVLDHMKAWSMGFMTELGSCMATRASNPVSVADLRIDAASSKQEPWSAAWSGP